MLKDPTKSQTRCCATLCDNPAQPQQLKLDSNRTLVTCDSIRRPGPSLLVQVKTADD